jgi:hypothetical protein
MSIRDTFYEVVAEEIIQGLLDQGQIPSAAEVAARLEDFEAENDLTKPMFKAATYTVKYHEPSSVTKWNNTNHVIHRDLKVLYKHLLKVADQSINNFERWRSEASVLEGRLDNLEERITSLLLLSGETAGFFNFVQDNFFNASKTDLTHSTTLLNVHKGLVQLGTSSLGATRYDMSHLRDEDFRFNVLSRNYMVARASAEQSRIRYATSDVNNFWQERIVTSRPTPVSIELTVDLRETLTLSRLDIDLHQANSNSAVQITPMLSLDNYTFIQLPSSVFTRSIIDKATFQFKPTQARWVKFIMTKNGFDIVQRDTYSYEFGVNEIAFYNEGFAPDQTAVHISKPLFVRNIDGHPEEFSKVVLEVCEEVPENTNINYYIATSNSDATPLNQLAFVAIDPMTREITTKPTVLDFGDLDTVLVPNVRVSYDPDASEDRFINPAQSFTGIVGSIGTTPAVTNIESSEVRYSFLRSNDRILDYQFATELQIAQGSLEIWRNVRVHGNENKVRGNKNGWGFSDPYYKTTIYIGNAQGMDIDFGGKAVIIDGVPQTGRINIRAGKHVIEVHKDNWKYVDPLFITNLSDLQSFDVLYPYNHRYLVEGFDYPVDYPDGEAKVYRGFDIVAEIAMQQVSPFDLINNIAPDDYTRFAMDFDAVDDDAIIDTVPGQIKESMRAILLKCKDNNPDFINEKFLIKFKAANSLFRYLWLKAEMSTTDETITPLLDAYRIKISS